jgi:hypothetical protein
VLVLALVLACGARTGLLVADRDGGADAGEPDAPYGEFPCTYGRSGDLVPVGSDRPVTDHPSLAWGGGRLLAAYRGTSPVSVPAIEICAAEADPYLSCVERWELGAPAADRPVIAAGADGFALCWSVELPRVMIDVLDASGRQIMAQFEVLDDRGVCGGLAWAADRYWALLHFDRYAPDFTVASFDPLDPRSTLDLHEFPGGLSGANASLDGADDVAAFAGPGTESSVLSVYGLSGTGFDEVIVSRERWDEVSVSVRDDEVGVLWTELGPGGRSILRFALVDAGSGSIHHETEVARDEGVVDAVELEAVWDGFLVGTWSRRAESDHLAVVPMRFGDGETMDVRSEILVYDGPSVDLHDISLTDDGHVAFVGTTLPDEATGRDQALLQLLSCHR